MEMFVYVVLAFGLGLFIGWYYMARAMLRVIGKVVPMNYQPKPVVDLTTEVVDQTTYAECEACGELDDLTETWYSTGGPEESSVYLCPSCQNNDEVVKEVKIYLPDNNDWYGA